MEKKRPKWIQEIIDEGKDGPFSSSSYNVEPSNVDFNESAFLEYLEEGEISEERMKMLMNF
jgi:hypothetical protein